MFRSPFRGQLYKRGFVPSAPAVSGAMSGTAAIIAGQSAQLTGSGSLAGTSAVVVGQSAQLGGRAAIAGTSAIVVGQSAQLRGLATLSGTAAAVFGQSAQLTGAGGNMTGTCAVLAGQSAQLTGTGTLLGTAPIVFGQSAQLGADVAISGTAAIVFGQSARLTAQGAAPSAVNVSIPGAVFVLRTETNAPIQIALSDSNGGISGLTVVAAIRDAATTNSYLDFNDNTFKTSGWSNKTTALTDVGSGFYSGNVDLSSITNLPSSNHLVIEYTVTGSVAAAALGMMQFDNTWTDPRALTIGKYLGLQ